MNYMKLKKKLATVLALAMVFSLFAFAPAFADPGDGDGTPGNPLQIGTADELLDFAERVTDGETTLSAILTDDIKVESDWTAIGKQEVGTKLTEWVVESTTPYAGTFDGGGYTLTLSKTGIDLAQANATVALFHTVGTDGVIRNVNLDVDFEGYRYIAGAAVYNYGTIEYVTVDGTISAVSNTAYAAGIASFNGCKTVEGKLVPGKILHCVNKATIDSSGTYTSGPLNGLKSGNANVGGICANFLGEMRYCANLGDVWVANNSSGLTGGGLFAIRNGLKANEPVQSLIVSDCYNAGTVHFILSSNSVPVTATFGGLFGVYNESYIMHWLDSNAIKISNVFNYGLIENPYPETITINTRAYWNIIGFGHYAQFSGDHVYGIFSNVYYLPEIGGRLFGGSAASGDDGYGTNIVKTIVHSKTKEEFATAELAAALNAGHTGADAPWEYVDGNKYPTLKFERDTYALTVNSGIGGTAGGTESGEYAENAEISVTATASSGYHFKDWTVDGVTLPSKTANPLTFAMPANAVTLTANFEADGGGTGKTPLLITDPATNITIDVGAGILPEDATLGVNTKESGTAEYSKAKDILADVGTNFVLYDITLSSAGTEIHQLGSTVKVSLPVPGGLNASRIAVYRIEDSGSKTLLESEVSGGKLSFITDHFSLYAIVERAAEPEQNETTEKKTEDTVTVTDLSAAKVTVADKVWTGKKIASGFVVSVNGKKLTLGTDYTVASTGANKSIGKGTVTIAGKDGYGKTATATFRIVPKAVKIKSAKAGKKSLTVKWSSAPKAEKVTKYQVRFRLKGAAKWSAAKAVSSSKASLAIKKLKKGKKYQVQARAYKTVSGVKYYSAWSNIKTSGKVK